jgi:hypothetical protein
MKGLLYGLKIDRLDKRADTHMRRNFPVFEAEPCYRIRPVAIAKTACFAITVPAAKNAHDDEQQHGYMTVTLSLWTTRV